MVPHRHSTGHFLLEVWRLWVPHHLVTCRRHWALDRLAGLQAFNNKEDLPLKDRLGQGVTLMRIWRSVYVL